MNRLAHFLAPCLVLLAAFPLRAADKKPDDETPFDVREHYTKYEYRIPMRDGVKLFTAVYVPQGPLPSRTRS